MTIQAKARHTPGPWQTRGRFITGTPERLDRMYHIYQGALADDSPFAACSTEADARLIAAAPELLEALKAILHIRRWDLIEADGVLDMAEAAIAKAAIAKAEGND